MSPFVSVVMPLYNAEQFVESAVKSILTQTYSNLELIMVDDFSTDSTARIVEQISDDRVKLYYNDQNHGISYTTNLAISKCQGKYIALMDDDDISEPNRLDLQVSFLENNPSIDILGGRGLVIDANDNITGMSGEPRTNPKYIRCMLLFHNQSCMNSSMMIRKTFLEQSGLRYDEGCHGMQDLFFLMKASKLGQISAIPDIIIRHRLHSHNETSHQFDAASAERADTYARFHKLSLAAEGFTLSEADLQIINRILVENTKDRFCSSVKDVLDLFEVFQKILSQSSALQLIFQSELRTYLRNVLYGTLPKIDIFDTNVANSLLHLS